MPYPTIEKLAPHTSILLNSYSRYLGKELIFRTGNAHQDAQNLIQSEWVVLSCNADVDPVLNFANLRALQLWEWDQMIQTKAKETAEPDERNLREQLLKQVQLNGYAENYTGVRISRTGKRFLIQKACVWNLVSNSGVYLGQSAAFKSWEYL